MSEKTVIKGTAARLRALFHAAAERLAGEKGAALATTLMFLVILTALGLAAVMTSSTEVMVSRNDRLNKLALNYANAGVAAALAKLDTTGAAKIGSDGKVGTVTPSDTWTFQAGAAEMSDITDIDFDVTVSYRIEDGFHYHGKKDGEGIADNGSSTEVVSYSKNCGYTYSPIEAYASAFPVYHIVSTGKVMQGSSVVATAKVEVDVTRSTFDLNVPGGMYSKGCPTVSGTVDIVGLSKPGIVTAATGCSPSGGAVTISGGGEPDGVSDGDVMVNMSSFLGFPVSDIQKYATMTEDGGGGFIHHTGDNYGNYSTVPEIVYVHNLDPTKEITLNGGVGYGVLVVDGNLKMEGGFVWHGLVYAMGNVDLGGGAGGTNIDGCIMADGSVNTLHGTVNVDYNQSIIDKIVRQGFKSRVINWKRIYN